jgi:D-psicose/D-tagatose/L-ribulose 3-epimerase
MLTRAVQVASELGAGDLCGVLYSRLAKYRHLSTQRSRDHVIEAMQHLAKHADAAGVRVNLEVVNRYETNVANTAAQMLDLLTTPARRGVHLDTYT